MMVRLALESNGYTVLLASNGADAIEICQRQPGRIDLLVTDVVMPGWAAGNWRIG
jgi:CheY-like chemotaxis protein